MLFRWWTAKVGDSKSMLLMKKILFVFSIITACLPAQAAISVGDFGSGVIDFSTLPAPTEWATKTISGTDALLANAAAVLTAVNSNATAANVTAPLRDYSPTNPPAQNALASWSSGGTTSVWTRPTGNGATLVMASLTNAAISNATSLRITYALGESGALAEQVAAHQVFYSLTGLSNSWVNIAALSGGTNGARSNTFNLSPAWATNSVMYILWADDNATGGTDRGYSIDDVTFTAGYAPPTPLTVMLTAPTSNALTFIFTNVLVVNSTTNVTLSATTAGTTPATGVAFYTNGVLAASDTVTPFSVVLSNLPPGVYTVYAEATNGVDPNALSATNMLTIIARDEFIHYTGSALTENFDGMGAAGTLTPVGWYVGGALPANSPVVTAGDGTLAANAAILGWNLGTNGAAPDTDRALGTAPTGADRNIVARIRNGTANNIIEFILQYRGEVWRNYTNIAGSFTNYVSYDLGASWIPTTYDFFQPFAAAMPPGPVDGNRVGNFTDPVGGGLLTPPAPIPPGGVIYIRWQDFNDAGLDGSLAIDDFYFEPFLDTFNPFVLITVPTNGATFAAGANVTITAVPTMLNPVTNVTFFRDAGTLIGLDTSAPFSFVYSNAQPGVHTLTATAQDNTGASVSTTNVITITVNPNVPPTITLTNPAAGSTYRVGVTVTNVSASATDPDGTIARVEFLLDGALWATDATSPYSFDLCDLTAGLHTIEGVAVDSQGVRVTNSLAISATNPPAISVIVSNGAAWTYLDNGTDQSNAWQVLAFDDSGWSNGVAEFGYGDAPGRPERTTVGFGGVANAKFATTYFRKAFDVANPAAFSGLTLNVLADDHFVVYLNGTQVFTDMTNSVITFATYALPAVPHDGTVYVSTNLPTSVLLVGTNLLAVEIHQDTTTSSDISFDLMLWGASAGGPSLRIVATDPAHAQVSWEADAIGYTLQQNTGDVGNPTDWSNFGGVITGAGSTTVAYPPPDRMYFRLIR